MLNSPDSTIAKLVITRRAAILTPFLGFIGLNKPAILSLPGISTEIGNIFSSSLGGFQPESSLQNIISINYSAALIQPGNREYINPDMTSSVGHSSKLAFIAGYELYAQDKGIKLNPELVVNAIHDQTDFGMRLLREDIFKKLKLGDADTIGFYNSVANLVQKQTGIWWSFPGTKSADVFQINVGSVRNLSQMLNTLLASKVIDKYLSEFSKKDFPDAQIGAHVLRNNIANNIFSSDGGYFADTDARIGTSGQREFLTTVSSWVGVRSRLFFSFIAEVVYRDPEISNGEQVLSGSVNTAIRYTILPAIGKYLKSLTWL